jgi:DNA-binding CsgD family transcriptional regulator
MTMAARRVGDEDEASTSTPVALSAAERDVATLVAEGLTNAAIGKRRGTSIRTVANQMASIFRKLGLKSRHDLAARIASLPSGKAPR